MGPADGGPPAAFDFAVLAAGTSISGASLGASHGRLGACFPPPFPSSPCASHDRLPPFPLPSFPSPSSVDASHGLLLPFPLPSFPPPSSACASPCDAPQWRLFPCFPPPF